MLLRDPLRWVAIREWDRVPLLGESPGRNGEVKIRAESKTEAGGGNCAHNNFPKRNVPRMTDNMGNSAGHRHPAKGQSSAASPV